MIAIGSETKCGKVIMVGRTGGERYYWMEDKLGGISMMPADVVERGTDEKDTMLRESSV